MNANTELYAVDFTREKADLSKKIKALRKASKITQVDLAAKMDVDVKTIKNLESGKYNPTFELLIKLARALKVDLRDLLSA